jgi:electron transport complex protein RnfG
MAVKSSFKNMTLCLLVICLVCSTLLALVYAVTKEPIEISTKARNEAAIKEVLPETASIIDPDSTLTFNGKGYTYNIARDKDTTIVGYAINVEPVGFGGPIKMKVGITADSLIWNVKVLSHAETPGLGAKCTEPAFSGQFQKLNPSDPNNLKVTKDKGNINAITASTITSRAYVEGVAQAFEVFKAISKEE